MILYCLFNDMKKYLILTIIGLSVIAIIILMIISRSKPEFRIVRLKGGTEYLNYSEPICDDNFLIMGNNRDSLSALPLSDGDLLGVGFKYLNDFYIYNYSIKDGNNLNFRKDRFKILVNDQLKCIILNEDSDLLNNLIDLKPDEIRYIQSIYIEDSIPVSFMEPVKRIAEINPDIGFIIDHGFKGIDSLLSLFNPVWIFNYEENLPVDISAFKNLACIFTNGDIGDFKALAGLPGMHYLNFRELNDHLLPQDIPVNRSLKSLAIGGTCVNDLQFLEQFPELQEITIVENDTLIDITPLANLSNLVKINFSCCLNTSPLSSLDNLSSLKWLTFPANISSEDLNHVIAWHKDIKAIRLCLSDTLMDLSPLQTLKSLESLTLVGDTVNILPIYELDNLKYLSVPQELMDDSLVWNRLRSSLPKTLIVPNTGLCLGTGWLLLFLPLIGLLYLFRHFFLSNF